MARWNIHFRGAIIDNGEIHRFASGERGDKDCWYVFHGLAGAFGDWSMDIHEKWCVERGNLSYPDKENLKLQIETAKKKFAEEIQQRHHGSSLSALSKWNGSSEVAHSPYLRQKQVEAFGVRSYQDSLVIPLKDKAGKLWSLQWIAPGGTKRFLKGGRKKGCFHHIGVFEEGKLIYVTEGYATGASVYMATHQTTVIAFDAGNIDPVVEEIRRAHPKNPIIIAGNDDVWRDHNKGREKAEQAALKHGCSVVFAQFKSRESKLTDFNDLHVLEGLGEVKNQLERAQIIIENDPLPITSTLLPVLPFTLDMMPESLQPWIKDVAYRRQCSIDFVAIPTILMLSSLIGARCSIKPHEKDDWMVVPNLWGGILGDPGTLKTPVCGEVLFPLGYLESKATEDYNDKKIKYEAEKTAFIEGKGCLERKIKDIVDQKEGALNKQDDLAFVTDELAAHLKNSPTEPAYKRYKVSDTTVEKMQEILSQNSRGVLVFRDELMGFLESWEKKGHESDRCFYLEAWKGDKSYTIDRIGRGMVHAENICVSILGTTQPDKISTYLHKAIKKLDNDGLLQRFQLLVYPDKKSWSLVDEYPDHIAKNRVFEICKTIDAMVFGDYGAQAPEPLYEGQYTIPFFRLSTEAQAPFHEWLKRLQEKLDSNDHPIILQHLSKYRSLMPSLALIFHVVDNADGKRERDISLSSVQKAAAWCDYLESHARRIYGMVLDTTFEAVPTLSKAEELLAWMRKQTSRSDQPLKRRFILRYSKFRSSKDLDLLLSDLVQMGYIQEGSKGTFHIVHQALY
ncbi:MAG: DUF3987 domain-containing protein [Alphaproteobacteria bacterium]|nr:DUF3987 domain-containing protein [Alphaproteobacteria bacterium]